MTHYLFVLMISMLFFSCDSSISHNWEVTPYPNSITVEYGDFRFDDGISISMSDSVLLSSINIFSKKLGELEIAVKGKAKNKLTVELLPNKNGKDEAYTLKIEKHNILLKASNPAGIFYGLMTVWQGVKFSDNNTIPCGFVEDKPRYKYRGFMLDESRHFFGKEKVKQIIDMMSVFKLNTFHWHLTDDPGWRIEIKSFPKLTTLGGRGDYSNPNTEAKYYTQEEIQEIVTFAAERFVTIIPEIDMPGHAAAANRAYPEYSGGGSEKHPDFTFNPGKEKTYAYLTTILREVSAMFPSTYIHLGGDEVHFGNDKWAKDPGVKLLMANEKLKTLKDVEDYFMRRIADSLKVIGKKVAGWDEVTGSGIEKENLLIYWWRHDNPEYLKKSLEEKYKVVLCPRVPLYFDFVQEEEHKNGRKWAGQFGRLEDVYHYPDSFHVFTSRGNGLIQGIQGNMWTERFQTGKEIDYMMYPRMFALAESAWTEKSNKDYIRFQSILPYLYTFLDEYGLNYFNKND